MESYRNFLGDVRTRLLVLKNVLSKVVIPNSSIQIRMIHAHAILSNDLPNLLKNTAIDFSDEILSWINNYTDHVRQAVC